MIVEMARSVLAVLLAGLCFGAGLPALFTVGITLWSRATPEPGPDGVARRKPLALAGAVLCFAIVLAAVVIGVLWITRKSLDHYLGISVFG
ncbi:Uncharacterised protein [Kocuria rhizophila]|uniref:Uncharacterized protein n=4 Tax=Micrococcaceae TaxID=1268 RepID=B2GJA4_KOCRD|nr:hypothetical protein [Kocuria sp.]ASE11642.1 hypothetical protein CEP81_08320 [Kocuria rhizophila]QMS56053.1 hypothetical protein CIB50_0000753 [Kocuria varians]BAG30652.1 hypothetical protein KRH_23050 [Kocuria rhizophila DC2201]MCC5674480.1 hypothetical protein [Kocuria rhizophila]VEH74084.1 Uncharacterised protein [Kocuria rhizophila]